jgi:hypothetical protein
MTYTLPDGGRVHFFRTGADTVEFIHYNRNDEVTATVRKSLAEAGPLIAALAVAETALS